MVLGLPWFTTRPSSFRGEVFSSRGDAEPTALILFPGGIAAISWILSDSTDSIYIYLKIKGWFRAKKEGIETCRNCGHLGIIVEGSIIDIFLAWENTDDLNGTPNRC